MLCSRCNLSEDLNYCHLLPILNNVTNAGAHIGSLSHRWPIYVLNALIIYMVIRSVSIMSYMGIAVCVIGSHWDGSVFNYTQTLKNKQKG